MQSRAREVLFAMISILKEIELAKLVLNATRKKSLRWKSEEKVWNFEIFICPRSVQITAVVRTGGDSNLWEFPLLKSRKTAPIIQIIHFFSFSNVT